MGGDNFWRIGVGLFYALICAGLLRELRARVLWTKTTAVRVGKVAEVAGKPSDASDNIRIGLPVYEFTSGARQYWYVEPSVGPVTAKGSPSIDLLIYGEGVPDVRVASGSGQGPGFAILIPVFCLFTAAAWVTSGSWKLPAVIFGIIALLELMPWRLISESGSMKFWTKHVPFLAITAPLVIPAGEMVIVPYERPTGTR